MIGAPCKTAAIPPQTMNSTPCRSSTANISRNSVSTGNCEPSDPAGKSLSVAQSLDRCHGQRPADQIEIGRIDSELRVTFAVVWIDGRFFVTLARSFPHLIIVPEPRQSILWEKLRTEDDPTTLA